MESSSSAEIEHPLTWKEVLSEEKKETYFSNLISLVEEQRKSGKIIYPKNSEIFAALQLCPLEKIKVVILGQDPYHGTGQAHGLCFSVRPGIAQPPSLKNIFKEIKNDLGIPPAADGCLTRWAEQGVLLLNSVLTVEASKPASHANLGWEKFTDRVIEEVSSKTDGVVFMLWGSYAHKKGERIDQRKHLVLKAPHPSPFSADRGFFGSKHFSQANNFLGKRGKKPIAW